MQLTLFGQQDQGAIIINQYRYLLWRKWDPSRPHLLWIMLNPSQADQRCDDPTLRRVIGFSRTFGFGGLEVVNLFALRSPSPKALTQVPELDAIGPENDHYIREAVARAGKVVVAWGEGGTLYERDQIVLSQIQQPFCLGTTRGGRPRHPLYVKGDAFLLPL